MRWKLALLLAVLLVSPARADECEDADSTGCQIAGLVRMLSWLAKLPCTIYQNAIEPDLRRQLERTTIPTGARLVQDARGRTHWVLDFVPAPAPDRYRRE